MSFRSKLRIFVIVCIAIAIIVFVPGVIRLNNERARLASTLQVELGRKVTLGNITFGFFPRPHFTISRGFAIADDPAFSAQPLLHAESVDADLRLSSLWRGRIEIAKIVLHGPVLNLVHGANRHWNVEGLILRASQIPSAPTSKRKAESRPRFPYIEAQEGRIDLRQGNVNSVYALADTDLSWWLESDDHWNFRLEARPIRTDMPVSDSGTIRLSGNLGRAPQLATSMLAATLELDNAQLGQIGKLLFGEDAGWRGSLNGTFTMQGPLAHLQLASRASIAGFRRYDVATNTPMDLSFRCSAYLNSSEDARSLDAIACMMPLDPGQITLTGMTAFRATGAEYALSASALDLPANMLAIYYRNAKQSVAPDLHAAGKINAHITRVHIAGRDELTADGDISGLRIESSQLPSAIVAPNAISITSSAPAPIVTGRRKNDPNALASMSPPPLAVNIARAPLPLLGDVSGVFDTHGWTITLDADTEVPYAIAVARVLGVTTPFRPRSGSASGKVQLAGAWTGYSAAGLTGDLWLKDIVSGEGDAAISISQAELLVAPSDARLMGLRASLPGADLELRGSVGVDRPCASPAQCRYTVALSSTSVDVQKIAAFASRPSGILDSIFRRGSWVERNRELLAKLDISGTIGTDVLSTPRFDAQNASAAFELANGVLDLRDVHAALFNGEVSNGKIHADLSQTAPAYTLTAAFARVNASALAKAFGDTGIGGTLDGTMALTMSGSSQQALAFSSKGDASLLWKNATISDMRTPLAFNRIAGTMSIADHRIALQRVTAIGANGLSWDASGSINFAHVLDLTFTRGTDVRHIDGALPRLISQPQSQPLRRASK